MSKVKSASAEMASKSEPSKNPSSKNLDDTPTPGPSHSHRSSDDVTTSPHPLYSCSDPDGCVSLQDILKSFNASISEEQAWALIYRFVSAYRASVREPEGNGDFKVPVSPRNYKLHRDGMVHVQFSGEGMFNMQHSKEKTRKPCSFIDLVSFQASSWWIPIRKNITADLAIQIGLKIAIGEPK